MEHKQRLIDLVRKLLALAGDAAATPAEAATAANKAAELIERHAINRELLGKADRDSEQEIEKNIYHVASAMWRIQLLQAVAKSCFCHLVKGSGQTMYIVGEREHFEVATFLYEYLVREIDRLADLGWELSPSNYPRRLNDFWRPVTARTWKSSFRAGATATVARRLHERRQQRAATAPTADTAALVVANNRLAKKLTEFFPKLIHTRNRWSIRNGSALAAGKLAGERIPLRDAVGTGRGAPAGRLALRGA